MQRFQPRQQRCKVAVLGMRHRGDAAPRQGIVVGALAELAAVHADRERDVRDHALVLGAAAGHAEELGDGQLDLAEARALVGRPAVQVDQVLYRALAEAGFSDHHATAVVLHRAGENLRGRGRTAIDQHRQRAVPGNPGLAVGIDSDPAAGLAHLHHRALVDEQAGQFDRLVQRTTAVVAQVQHHAVHALRLEAFQQAADVTRSRGVVVGIAAAALEILVERGQLDHPDAARGLNAQRRQFDHLGLGRLLLQLDLLPGDGDLALLPVHAHLGGQVIQAHLGILLAADLGHHVVDAPADHVGHRARTALAHADNAVTGLERAIEVGGPAGDDLADHHHVVLALQLRTDAFQRQ